MSATTQQSRTGTAKKSAARNTKLAFVTDELKEAARTPQATAAALQMVGAVATDGTITCPACGKGGLKIPGETKIHPDGGKFVHYNSPRHCVVSGIDIVMGGLDLGFLDAVRALNGLPASVPIPDVSTLRINLETTAVRSTPDPEVYAGLLTYGRKNGGVEAAIEFYGEYHIHPDVVRHSGAVYITDTRRLEEKIVRRYGTDRLVQCGLMTMVVDKQKEGQLKPFFLINSSHPVIEPAFDVSGKVVNMQFRASHATNAKVLAHKRDKSSNKPKDKQAPYVPKFLNLKGINPGVVNLHQIVANLPEGEELEIVEGFKDRLAASSFGRWAVGFPGVGYQPTPTELDVLRRYRCRLRFDGDEAGLTAMYGTDEKLSDGTVVHRPGWLETLAEAGLHVTGEAFSDGLDYTDNLVLAHAINGGCREHRGCREMAKRYDFTV